MEKHTKKKHSSGWWFQPVWKNIRQISIISPTSGMKTKTNRWNHHLANPTFTPNPTWRIIPVSKWLVSPIYKPWNAHLEGEQPQLGDLLAMVINHLLNGMILQVVTHGDSGSSTPPTQPPGWSTSATSQDVAVWMDRSVARLWEDPRPSDGRKPMGPI